MQPLGHSVCPTVHVGMTQTPVTQLPPAGHLFPQAPQLCGSEVTSVQPPGQAISPTGQVVPGATWGNSKTPTPIMTAVRTAMSNTARRRSAARNDGTTLPWTQPAAQARSTPRCTEIPGEGM